MAPDLVVRFGRTLDRTSAAAAIALTIVKENKDVDVNTIFLRSDLPKLSFDSKKIPGCRDKLAAFST